MAIVVEHEKRKREILEKSFQLFIEDGYEDVTYQKIADKCGITRTTLYIYFKNKREIFLWSIKQLTNDVEQELIGIIKNNQIDSIECLKRIFLCIIHEKCIKDQNDGQKQGSVRTMRTGMARETVLRETRGYGKQYGISY